MPDREPVVPVLIEKEEVADALRRLATEVETGAIEVESYYEGRSVNGSDMVVVLSGKLERF